MRRLAGDLGMKAPSLYKHFLTRSRWSSSFTCAGLEESTAAFETALAARLGVPCIAALWGGVSPVSARASAHLPIDDRRPLPRERLPVGLEYRAAAPLAQAMGSVAERGLRGLWRTA